MFAVAGVVVGDFPVGRSFEQNLKTLQPLAATTTSSILNIAAVIVSFLASSALNAVLASQGCNIVFCSSSVTAKC